MSNNDKYIYTLGGNIVPLLVGFFAVPFTLKYFGVEIVGFVAICWLLVGYSGIFDLGLSRSMTVMVSRLLPNEEYDTIRKYFWTTFKISFIFSVILTVLIYYFSSNIISWFKISDNLSITAVKSFQLLSLSAPFIILSSVLVGFLTSFISFGKINVVKIPIGILMMLAPIISYFLNLGVIGIMYILLIARILSFVCYLLIILNEHPFVRKVDWGLFGLADLLNQGVWMTLSNIISPLIVNFDRFVLGSLISVQAVAYYSTVYDVISKLHIIPTTFVTVLFPLFAFNSLSKDSIDNSFLIKKYSLIIILLIGPMVFLTQIWSYDLISIWINPSFADKSYQIAMILLIGIFWNCLAQIPFTFLQANGYSSKTALFHIVELIIFLPVLYLAISIFGIKGAAIAWTIRVLMDFLLLFYYSNRISKHLLGRSITFFAVTLSLCSVIILIIDAHSTYNKIALTIFMFLTFIYFLNNNKSLIYSYGKNEKNSDSNTFM